VRNGKDPNRWLNQSHHYLMTLSNQERNSQQKLKLDAVAQKSKIAVRDLTESYVAASLKLPIHLAKQFPEFIQSHREVIAMKREIDTKKKQQTKP
jgi:flagellar hook-length control protein FliK